MTGGRGSNQYWQRVEEVILWHLKMLFQKPAPSPFMQLEIGPLFTQKALPLTLGWKSTSYKAQWCLRVGQAARIGGGEVTGPRTELATSRGGERASVQSPKKTLQEGLPG